MAKFMKAVASSVAVEAVAATTTSAATKYPTDRNKR